MASKQKGNSQKKQQADKQSPSEAHQPSNINGNAGTSGNGQAPMVIDSNVEVLRARANLPKLSANPEAPTRTPCVWGPTDEKYWSVVVRMSDQLRVSGLLLSVFSCTSFEKAHFVVFAISRDNIADVETWEKIQEIALLVIGGSKEIKKSTLPGMLHVWPERCRGADKRSYGTVERWSVPDQLKRIAQLVVSVVPDCKLAVDAKFGKPVLAVQVEGTGLATIINRARAEQLQTELRTASTMSSMFLEMTAAEEHCIVIPGMMRDYIEKVTRDHPTVMWTPSHISGGSRMIALFPGGVTMLASEAYEEDGVIVTFAPEDIKKTSAAENRITNKTIVRDTVAATTNALIEVAKDVYGSDFLERRAQPESASMADGDQLDEEILSAARADIVQRGNRISKAMSQVMARLTRSAVHVDERESIARSLKDLMPKEEEVAMDTFIAALENARGLRDVLSLIEELHAWRAREAQVAQAADATRAAEAAAAGVHCPDVGDGEGASASAQASAGDGTGAPAGGKSARAVAAPAPLTFSAIAQRNVSAAPASAFAAKVTVKSSPAPGTYGTTIKRKTTTVTINNKNKIKNAHAQSANPRRAMTAGARRKQR